MCPMTRRQAISAAAAVPAGLAAPQKNEQTGPKRRRETMDYVMSVRGPIPAPQLGRCLPHEHIMVDFVGADKTGPHRWQADEVMRIMKPFVDLARREGLRALVECTPAYLGRDPALLKRMSEATGVHIITNTGYYKEPYLPKHAFEETVDQLADRWEREWEHGIDGTGIRPGFIKIAVNPAPLAAVQRKIVAAAARASRRTGLTIACHTGHGPAALEVLDILRSENLPASRFIFVHADGEADRKYHLQVARAGAWVEYDSVGWRPVEDHVKLIMGLAADGLADRLLVSHDGGWYHVGEPNGGQVKPFTVVHGELTSALRRAGLAPAAIAQVLEDNPRKAFTVKSTAPSLLP